jgi:hypothetical protein
MQTKPYSISDITIQNVQEKTYSIRGNANAKQYDHEKT